MNGAEIIVLKTIAKGTEMANEVDLVLKGGKIVTPDAVFAGSIAVENGKITAIAEDRNCPPAKKTIDVSGKYVIPGVVDPECHLGHAQLLEDDIKTETRAAVATGVTTWGMQLSSTVVRKSINEFQKPDDVPPWLRVFPLLTEIGDRHSMIDYYLTAKVMNDTHAFEIPQLAERHGVISFKTQLHLKSGTAVWDTWVGGRQQGIFGFDDGTVYAAMRNVARLGPPAIYSLHCENWEIARILQQDLIHAGRKDTGAWDDRSPAFCEAGHVRAYSYYAKITGCPLYIQHVTTPETVREIQRAKEDGVRVFGQTGSHYLSLPKDVWKINVPLRSQETIDRMWEALRDGFIDAVGSDHVNYGKSRKEMEVERDVWRTQSGFPSRVEALLPIMLSEGVNKGRITMQRLVEVCCSNPARIFGLLPQKGVLALGSDADLVVVDLDKRCRFSNDMVYCGAGWSIYDGWDIKGWPVMTISKGQVMMEWPDGERRPKIIGEPRGRYIHRGVAAR
jgi:dihydropyrimidinase/dihydroorotase